MPYCHSSFHPAERPELTCVRQAASGGGRGRVPGFVADRVDGAARRRHSFRASLPPSLPVAVRYTQHVRPARYNM